MPHTTSTVTVPRITPTAADVQQAAQMAAVVEISRKLKSLYAVTQADLRRLQAPREAPRHPGGRFRDAGGEDPASPPPHVRVFAKGTK